MCAVAKGMVPRQVCAISAWVLREINNTAGEKIGVLQQFLFVVDQNSNAMGKADADLESRAAAFFYICLMPGIKTN